MPKDNFSKQAALYAKFRPTYPNELYEFLYKSISQFDAAWDCATGNGQVAAVLSEQFKTVYATDISQKQLDNAIRKPNIQYGIGSAEASGLAPDSINLITVGQAIHWFDFDRFYKEVSRVSKPNAMLAYWSYGLIQINAQIDPLIRHFHDVTVGSYWDPERAIWANEYKDIHFPLHNQVRVNFDHQFTWDLEHLAGYLTTWSSVQKYIAKNGINPVNQLIESVSDLWKGSKTVTFSIFLIAGKVK